MAKKKGAAQAPAAPRPRAGGRFVKASPGSPPDASPAPRADPSPAAVDDDSQQRQPESGGQ